MKRKLKAVRIRSWLVVWIVVGIFSPILGMEMTRWGEFSSLENMKLKAVATGPDSAFYFVGSHLPEGEEFSRGVVVKTDAELHEEFTKSFSPEKGSLIFSDVLPLPGGKLLILGTEYQLDKQKIVLVYLSASGRELERYYLQNDENLVAYRFRRRQDGKLIVVGYSMMSSVESKDGVVLCLNSSGRILWMYKTREKGEDALLDVLLTPDGQIMASGYVQNLQENREEGFLLVLNEKGELIRKKQFTGQFPHRFLSLAWLNSSVQAVAGYLEKSGIWEREAVVMGVGQEGETLWKKATNLPESQDFRRVVAGWNNCFFVAGVKKKRVLNKEVPFFWKMSENGAKMESKSPSFPGSAVVEDMIQLASGDLIACGYIQEAGSISGLAIRLNDRNPIAQFKNLSLVIRYMGNEGANKIVIMEDGKIQYALKNSTSYPIQDSWLEIVVEDSTIRRMYDTTITNIYIPPGGECHGSIPLKLIERPVSGMAIISARFFYRGEVLLKTVKDQLSFQVPPPPRFALRVAQFFMKSEPSVSVEQVSVGEKAIFQAKIENSSDYWAGDVQVKWNPQSPRVEINDVPSKTIGNVAPHSVFEVSFQFTIDPNLAGSGKIPFELEISERSRESRSVLFGEIPYVKKKKEEIPHVTSTPEIAFPDPNIDVENEIAPGLIFRDNAFAVIIGNRNYRGRNDIPEVRFAHRDAMMMKKYFQEVLGLKEGNIFYLEDATKADFNRYFGTRENPRGKLYNVIQPGKSDVFIYYVGHGAPDPKTQKAYFVPADCDPNYVENTGYPLDLFYTNLAKLPARNITVFIDACFSGANVLKNISPLLVVSRSGDVLSTRDNVAVFTSSTGSQVSSWYPEKKHSLFTYFVAKGLSNFRADLNNDGKITVEELFRFVSNDSKGVPYMARFLHNVEQSPQLLGKNRDYVLTKGKKME